ncbi:MAG: putative zinc-binding peptidase [Methylococcaceae bacterium]|nr:putative zinc-binding peptidase [Methylococcaceae bacterium]MCI0734545.1 putative zinc-binding peptidase [Methylococcaceae bacterium]
MKRFRCGCGNEVFFENTFCEACSRVLGFDPETREIHTLVPRSMPVFESKVNGRGYRLCANFTGHEVCNWLVAEFDQSPFCQGCRLNRTIPDLDIAVNLIRWRKIEKAKKRLLYTLYSLRLPLVDKTRDPEKGLFFEFMENSRTDLHNVEDTVTTGHFNGVITINVLEADRLYREKMRRQMQEPYRTVLGHFRHEIGHYYWEYLFPDHDARSRFRKVFGDEQIAYAEALDRYYKNGPSSGWQRDHITAYAASHPLEDWAETWAHYLHMQDTLETARAWQAFISPQTHDFDADLQQWIDLTIVANQLNRSMGLADLYPFVITANVRKKLAFIHRIVQDSGVSD